MRGAVLAAALLFAATGVRAATPEDLLRAYPDALAGIENGELVWRDGTRMALDDGRPDKSFAEQLRHGSLLDQLREPYPAGAPLAPPRDSRCFCNPKAKFTKG